MLCRYKLNDRIYAMKVLKKSMVLEKDELAHTLTENSVLAKCAHPFLTSLHFSFQTPELLCFVMEYVNGGEVSFSHSRLDVPPPFPLRTGCFLRCLRQPSARLPFPAALLPFAQGKALLGGPRPFLCCGDPQRTYLPSRARHRLPVGSPATFPLALLLRTNTRVWDACLVLQ
jgi:hypothetical protein